MRSLLKRTVRLVFDSLAPVEALGPVVESFDQGWNVEVGADMASSDYLEGVDEIRGLREVAEHLGGGPEPERMASAIELVLEGLHLQNRLNKSGGEGAVRYGRAPAPRDPSGGSPGDPSSGG